MVSSLTYCYLSKSLLVDLLFVYFFISEAALILYKYMFHFLGSGVVIQEISILTLWFFSERLRLFLCLVACKDRDGSLLAGLLFLYFPSFSGIIHFFCYQSFILQGELVVCYLLLGICVLQSSFHIFAVLYETRKYKSV